MKKQYIVGLTGGIGAGKTEACIILESLGAYIIDADKVSRDLSVCGQKGYLKLKEEYPDFFDDSGNLMRKELREYIFNNNLSEKLNNSMFPIIIDEIYNRLCLIDKDIVFIVAPLLIESGMHSLCDITILIVANRDMRIARIIERDNIDRNIAEKMIESQLSDDERKKLSDIVIYNNYGKEDLNRKVKYFYEKIKKSVQENAQADN